MNYEDKTDLDLSMLVARKLGYKPLRFGGNAAIKMLGDGKGGVSATYFDINSPADMWPIIVDNKISIIHYPNGDCSTWVQGYSFGKFKAEDKNTLRSAAITFLMITENKGA